MHSWRQHTPESVGFLTGHVKRAFLNKKTTMPLFDKETPLPLGTPKTHDRVQLTINERNDAMPFQKNDFCGCCEEAHSEES